MTFKTYDGIWHTQVIANTADGAAELRRILTGYRWGGRVLDYIITDGS